MEQRQKKANKQKQKPEPESLPNKNTSKSNKDHKQKRPPPNSIPPSSEHIKTDSKSIPATTQQTKLPFNVPNEVLNLSASETLSKKFAKRELIKNWDKYDEESNDIIDNNDQMNAADFSKLLAAPPSTIDNHFFLNSEKNWHSSDQSQPLSGNVTSTSSLAGKYFNLNIMELTNNLQRLPFYVRQGYSEDLFSSKEIDEMKRKANLCEFKVGHSVTTDKIGEIGSKMLDILSNRDKSKNVSNIVEKKCPSPEKVVLSIKSDSKECNEMSLDNKQPETIIHQTDSDDELDCLLGLSLQSAPIKIEVAKVIQPSLPNVIEDNDSNLATSSAAVVQDTGAKFVKTKEDIQKWLDDILD